MNKAPDQGVPPDHWLFIDAAFSGPTGVARFRRGDLSETISAHIYGKKARTFAFWDELLRTSTLIVIQYPFVRDNIATAIKLGRAVGYLEAVAQSVGAEVVHRTASQWRKQLPKPFRGNMPEREAKRVALSFVRALAVHPDQRRRVKGILDRVHFPVLGGRELSEDEAEAVAGGVGYAIEQGWTLHTA